MGETPAHTPGVLLLLSLAGLFAGGAAHLGGKADLADAIWAATAVAALIPVLVGIAKDLLQRRARVDVIAVMAISGSLALGEYLAGAIIAVMMATGNALEGYAASRARQELAALMDRAPRVAHRYEHDALVAVSVDDIRIGDRLLVKQGEIVPVDGIVLSPCAVIDESALTGESRPASKLAGDRVSSGTVNGGSSFDLRSTATSEASTYAGIVRLVREAAESKAPLVRLADRYAVLFIPLTLVIAGAAWVLSGSPLRALSVLVVATPCPLLLAVPVAIVSGISSCARRGIIIKGGGALETLARSHNLLLDKTGTLTFGGLRLSRVTRLGTLDEEQVLELAASLEQASSHILAAALVQDARNRGLTLSFPTDAEEHAGAGMQGCVAGSTVRVGNAEWVGAGKPLSEEVRAFRRRASRSGALTLFVSVDGEVIGALTLEDPIRPDSPRTIRALRRAGIRAILMVTGDHPLLAESVGAVLGVDRVLSQCSPAEKVAAVRAARAEGPTIMVGDGINDAPALAAADVGVAMGARGATASSEAADVVLVVDRLDRLVDALRIARRSRAIAVQSVLLGMGLSLAAMGVATLGFLPPVAGALLQEGIDVVAILNALRALARGRQGRKAEISEAMGRRLKTEHETLIPMLEQVRTVADRIDRIELNAARVELEALDRFLTERLLPHERADDTEVYPVVAGLLGGEDPLAPMSRTHHEIFRLVRLFSALLGDLGPQGPSAADLSDLRGILYGLHAVLELHFAQEEELYSSLDNHYLERGWRDADVESATEAKPDRSRPRHPSWSRRPRGTSPRT